MKGKIWIFILLVSALTVNKVYALGVADIPAISTGSVTLYQDAMDLVIFSQKLTELQENNFQIPIANSTQTATVNNTQKAGLIFLYQKKLQELQDAVNRMPHD